MRYIDIRRPHALGIDGARRAAQGLLHKIVRDRGLHLEARWHGDSLHVRGRGFKAHLHPFPDSLQVTADLGLALRPFRRRIQDELTTYMDAYLQKCAHAAPTNS